MNKMSSILVLNTLIGINNDRIAGYQMALNATEEFDLKHLFENFIQTSRKCKRDLMEEINKMGASAMESSILNGKFFSVWMDIKSALNGKDRNNILTSCEIGDNAAVKTYTKILDQNEKDITLFQYTMINIQHTYIRADHNKIKDICQSFI